MTGLAIALAAVLSWWDPSAIRPQQKGVCITEWEGGARWEIPVEVLGMLDATAPEREAILVRLADERFAGTGVAAGMSGSPVYIEGKLLGALAFGWSFARDPLTGVTPFARMRDIAPGGATVEVPPATLAQLAALSAGSLEPLAILPRLPDYGRSQPLNIAVGGVPLVGSYASDLLAAAGFAAVPAGGTVPIAGVPEPGEMVAALMAWGDAIVAAGGTVTARDKDKLYAFGHPMLSLGAVRLPAARARVLAVQTSFQSSFKVFGVGEPFGTFVADRPAGMLALAGDPPVGLPFSVDVSDPTGSLTWRFHIADIPVLRPLLVAFLTNACLSARGAANGESSVQLRLEIGLADGRQVTLQQAARGRDALARMASFAGAAVSVVSDSLFPHPPVTSLRAQLERRESPLGARVAEVLPATTRVLPGQELEVEARLLPWREPRVSKRLSIRVPATIAPGKADLIVADGAAWTEYRFRMAGIMPASFTDELEQLGMLESSTTLVAVIETRERGVALPGASQPSLPPSWSATLALGLGERGIKRLRTAVAASVRWSAPYPLEGAFRIPLTVVPRHQEMP